MSNIETGKKGEDLAKEYLIKQGHVVSEIKKNKIGLEEYYIEIMSNKENS